MTTPFDARLLVDRLEAAVVDVGAVAARDAALSGSDTGRAVAGCPEPPD